MVVEQHAAMRFAWLRERAGAGEAAKPGPTNRAIFVAYNLAWWLPIVLGFTKIIDYRTAFVAFFAITLIRAAANAIRNNLLTLEQAELCPFRAP